MKISGKHVAAAVLIALSAALAFDSVSNYVNPYITVAEIVNGLGLYEGRDVQVMGLVAQGSLSRGEDGTLSFDLTDGEEAIRVVHKGPPPRNLDQGKQVVVVGRVSDDGLVESSKVLVKCPSKYLSEGPTPLGDHVFITAIILALAAAAYVAITFLLNRR